MSNIFVQANKDQLKRIRNELNEDDQKMKHYVKLFYDWLECEKHLPKDVDTKLVENYIRLSKLDLQKAKDKFEKLIISTSKYKNFYDYKKLDPNFFSPYKYHRMAVTLPRLTPKGYRIFVFHMEDTDVTHFNMETFSKFILLNGIFTVLTDLNSGMVIILDFRNINVNIISKFDMMVFKNSVEIGLKMLPARVRGMHIINLPGFAEILFTWALTLLKATIRKRVVLHKTVDGLLDYFDRDLLPMDLGGTLTSLKEIGDDWKEFWMKSDELLKKMEKLKLMGPIPKNKLNGSFGCDMEGSFRRLTID